MVNLGEIPRAQLAKSTLLISTLGQLESFQIFQRLLDAKERVGYGKQRNATASIHPKEINFHNYPNEEGWGIYPTSTPRPLNDLCWLKCVYSCK